MADVAAAESPVDRLRRRAAALRARLEAEVRSFDLPLCLVHERMLLAQSELDARAERAGTPDGVRKGSAAGAAAVGEGRPGGDPSPPVSARERALSPPGRPTAEGSWVVVSPPGTVLEDLDWNQLVGSLARLRACEGVQIDARGIALRLRREPAPGDLAYVHRCWRSAGGDDTEWEVRPEQIDSESPAGRRGKKGSW